MQPRMAQYAMLSNQERESLMNKESAKNYAEMVADLDHRTTTEHENDLRLLKEHEPHIYEEVYNRVAQFGRIVRL